MNYELAILIIIISFVLILFIMRLLMPQIARREIFFGVRMPEALRHDPLLYEMKKAYVRNYLSICGLYTLIFCIALAKIPENSVLFTGLGLFFLLSTWLFYLSHQRVREFKKSHENKLSKKQIVIVDTSFRNEQDRKILPWRGWFLLPLSIIIFNIIAGHLAYDRLPIVVATHWNAQGIIDGGVFKTYGVIYIFPLVELYITVLIYLLYKTIGWSKQQIDAANPEESKERNRVFRYRWGVNLIFLNVVVLMVITILNLFVLQVIPVNITLLLFAQPLLIIFILLDILVMAMGTGQGGSRLQLPSNCSLNSDGNGPDDDKYWIGGLFYFNPQDPALFVEKRFGIAWGLNYGLPRAYVLLALVAGSFLLLNFLMELLLVY